MPQFQVPEQQILDSLDQLSPEGRRAAIRRLIPFAGWLDESIDRNHSRIVELARERGFDWESLADTQKEQLIDELLHE